MTDQPRLLLTPEPDLAIEQERLERETQYRRRYWQDYKKRHIRVFGTLAKAEHAAVKAIADQNDRPVWSQIWAESCAYRSQSFLPAPEIMARQDRMIAELRRIGNNLNQLARQGHVQDLPHGADTVEAFMAALEDKVIAFTQQPWRTNSPRDDQ